MPFLLPLFLILASCGTFAPVDKEGAQMHLQIGVSQLDSGAYPQALVSLLQAEKLDDTNPIIQNNLGIAYLVRDRYELAERHIRKALSLKPDYTDARNNLGKVLLEQGRYQEAIRELKTALEDLTHANPEKPLVNLGIVYFKLGDLQNSRTYLTKALNIQRDNCLAHSYLGRTFYEAKDFHKASQYLDRAVGFCQKGEFDEPHYYSALSYYSMGDTSKAETRFSEVIRLYPNGQYVDKSKEMLKTIHR